VRRTMRAAQGPCLIADNAAGTIAGFVIRSLRERADADLRSRGEGDCTFPSSKLRRFSEIRASRSRGFPRVNGDISCHQRQARARALQR